MSGTVEDEEYLVLHILEQDLGLFIGLTALGTLHAIRSRLVSPDAGQVLAWPIFREPLEGRVPQALIDILAGMDEIGVFDRIESASTGADGSFLEQQIAGLERLLADLYAEPYSVVWADEIH
jgi:hypothetical protein